MACSGKECRYVKVWADHLRDFETWSHSFHHPKFVVTPGATGVAKKKLKAHAESLRVEHWVTPICEGEECECKGKWKKDDVTKIPLKVVDKVTGVIVICTADWHREEYIGTCQPKKKAKAKKQG